MIDSKKRVNISHQLIGLDEYQPPLHVLKISSFTVPPMLQRNYTQGNIHILAFSPEKNGNSLIITLLFTIPVFFQGTQG